MIIENHPLFSASVTRSMLAAFEHSQFSLVITDALPGPDGQKFLYANASFKQQTQYNEDELRGQTPRILQGPKTDSKVIDQLRTALQNQATFLGQTVNYRKDGSAYIVRWSINPLLDEDGQVVAYVSNQMEVSEQVKDRDQALFLAEAVNQSADAIMITDLEDNILYCNRAFVQLSGYDRESLIGMSSSVLQSHEMPSAFLEHMRSRLLNNQVFEGVFLSTHRDGHEFYERKSITPVLDVDGHPRFYVVISRDTSESVRKSDALKHQAYHDPLTGLYNRAKFDEVIAYNFNQWQLHGKIFSLIFCDLDHFKRLNDTLGHDTGDLMLKASAESLIAGIRESDTVVRWGGEEFCIVVSAPGKVAQQIAEQLREDIRKIVPPNYGGQPLSMSFGVSEVAACDDAESLLARADRAVYQAKKSGRNCVVWLPTGQHQSPRAD